LTFSFPFTGSYNWVNGKSYSAEWGISPEINFIKGKNLFTIGAGVKIKDMLSYIPGADPDEDRDAINYKVLVGYNRLLKGGKSIIFFRSEFNIENTEGKNWDSNSWIGSGGIIYPLPFKGRMSFTFSIKEVWFRKVHTVTEDNYKNFLSGLPLIPGFPSTPTKRKDEVYTFSSVVSYSIKKRISVSGSISYLINNSNFAIYKYKKWIGGLEVRVSF
jgi:hypothetical protein